MTAAIRRCGDGDFEAIFETINDAAQAYKGVIPPDRWHDPYMSREALARELQEQVRFWAMAEGEAILGVMGIQDKGAVALIRHAYVRTAHRNGGIGSALLRHIEVTTAKPILIGTWRASTWAIAFYRSHGYREVPEEEGRRLLREFWNVPDRQIDTSVVLAREAA